MIWIAPRFAIVEADLISLRAGDGEISGDSTRGGYLEGIG